MSTDASPDEFAEDPADDPAADPAGSRPARPRLWPTRPSSTAAPPLLRSTGEIAWPALVIAISLYLLVLVLSQLYIVVLPIGVALLFTALLRPGVMWLRHRGWPRAGATWTVLLGFWVALGTVFYFVGRRATNEFPKVIDEATTTIKQVQHYLIHGPFHVKPSSINNVSNQIVNYLQQHRDAVTTGVLNGVTTAGEVATGLVFAVFVGFFLMYDGEGIAGWVIGLFPRRAQFRASAAAIAAWATLTGYIRGTLFIALFHTVVMFIALMVMGIPLAAPLALLVGLGSLIPLIGAFVFGGLAVLVTLATNGWLLAVILVGVLVLANQAEAHLLQPFVVGRSVHLHPLAIALVLTTGTVFGGIWGALFAVPFSSTFYSAWMAVSRGEEADIPGRPVTVNEEGPPLMGGDEPRKAGPTPGPQGSN